MITKFSGKEKDRNFYTPEPSGTEGNIPMAGQNYGNDNKIKSFKDFKIGEYRKGSATYGKLVNRIMEFLRLPEFKLNLAENDGLKFEISDFEKRSHINVDEIRQLIGDDHNLYNFDIDISKDNKFISFYNIKKTYKDRYVLGKKEAIELKIEKTNE